MVRPGNGPEGEEFTEFVRHSLHEAADQVEPGADGLERIREKIRSGPARATIKASLAGAAAGFLADLVRRWHAARARLTAWLDRRRAGSGPSHARPASRRPRNWREAILRPALAVGIAVFAVGVVLAAVPPLRHQILQTVGVSAQSSATSPSGSGPGQPLGASESALATASGSDNTAAAPSTCSSSPAAANSSKPAAQTTTPAAHSTSPTAPASHATASASDSASQSAGAGAGTSASATPSESTTPTPTRTATPTPSPSHSMTTIHQNGPTPAGSCTSSAAAPGGSPRVSSKPKTNPSGSSSPSASRSRSASASPTDTLGTSGANTSNIINPETSTPAESGSSPGP